VVLLGAIISQSGNVRVEATLRILRVIIVAVDKQKVLRILIVCLQPEVYSIQCACAVFSSVVCPVVQKFSALSRKSYDFRKKKLTVHGIVF